MAHKKSWRKSPSFRQSLRHAWRGLEEAVRRDRNIQRQLVVLIAALLLAGALRISVGQVEIIILLGALVIGLELMNSALEAAEDILHPRYHELIGLSKDIAAGAVLFVSLGAVIIGLLMFSGPLAAMYLKGISLK